jgi:predicted cobalt transporter CbtA
MESSSKLIQYFWALVEQLPSLLTLVGCIIFAITRWKRHPKVSLIVVAGLGLLILHALAFLIIYDVVPPLFINSADSYQNTEPIRRTVYLVIGLISNCIAAVAFALLLAGIFMQRKPALDGPQPG